MEICKNKLSQFPIYSGCANNSVVIPILYYDGNRHYNYNLNFDDLVCGIPFSGGTSISDVYLSGQTLYITQTDGSLFSTDLSTLVTSGSSSTVEFTGNTSGNCIVDLWVKNINGCSPLTINNSIKHIGCAVDDTLSVSFGKNNNMVNSTYSAIICGGGHTMNDVINCGIVSGSLNRLETCERTLICGGLDNGTSYANDCVTVGGKGNALSVSDSSGVYAGSHNVLLRSENSSIISGQYNTCTNSYRSSLIAGDGNGVLNSFNSFVVGGTGNVINNATESLIVGGIGNTSNINQYSTIIGGEFNQMRHTNSHIIGGSRIESDANNTTFVENLNVRGTIKNLKIETAYSDVTITENELYTITTNPIRLVDDPGNNKTIFVEKILITHTINPIYDYNNLGDYRFAIVDTKLLTDGYEYTFIVDRINQTITGNTFYSTPMVYDTINILSDEGFGVFLGGTDSSGGFNNPDSGSGDIRVRMWYKIYDYS